MGHLNKRIFSVDDLNDGDINRLFCRARQLSIHTLSHGLSKSNAVLMTAFFEPSTRTRLSFEMAAHRLGLKVSTFDYASSSINKGESAFLTIVNLLSLQPDFLVIRQSQPLNLSLPFETATIIINGGDGINEHPTQALLDCFTLLDYFKKTDFAKRKILIIGDIAHSRVAHSNIKLMRRLGARVTLLAPPCFQIDYDIGQERQVTSFKDLAGDDFDAVMCLRVQKERFIKDNDFDEATFAKDFGLSRPRLESLGAACAVLHPGPMDIGIEISADVATHSRSLINEQVKNGVVVRAALMKLYDRSVA